jgi:flagellar protein FlaG
MMIDRLSSNQFSSQPSKAEFGDIQMKERLVEFLPQAPYEGEKENVTFPKEKVVEIVDNLNKFMGTSQTSLKFEFHEKLNEYYVKIVDDVTKEIVREIPPKKMLDFYAAMTEFLGLMIDKKV